MFVTASSMIEIISTNETSLSTISTEDVVDYFDAVLGVSLDLVEGEKYYGMERWKFTCSTQPALESANIIGQEIEINDVFVQAGLVIEENVKEEGEEDFEFHFALHPSTQPIPAEVSVPDLLELIELTTGINLEDRGGNHSGNMFWRFWGRASTVETLLPILSGPHELGDFHFIGTLPQKTLFITLLHEDTLKAVDEEYLQKNAETFVKVFRLILKASVLLRTDGLFEVTSPGKLILSTPGDDPPPSVLKVSNVRYLCTPPYVTLVSKGRSLEGPPGAVSIALSPYPTDTTVSSSLPDPSTCVSSCDSSVSSCGSEMSAVTALSDRAGVPPPVVHAATGHLPPPPPKAATRPARTVPSITVLPSTTEEQTTDRIFADNSSAEAIVEKLDRMPGCAEKTLLELFYHLQYQSTKPSAVLAVRENFLRLRDELQDENLLSMKISRILGEIEQNISVWSATKTAKHVWQCLREAYPIDVDFLVSLLRRGQVSARSIEGKDVVLLLGYTGAGKSTAVHFLGGSSMKLEVVRGHDHLHITKCHPALANFVTSSECSSETLYINAVDLKMGEHAITLCDSPGWEDNRGVEIDIANGIGIINAVRHCHSVRPLLLMSPATAGERLDGIVKHFKTLSKMMDPFADQVPALSYWFSKYDLSRFKNTDYIYEMMNKKLNSLKDELHVDDGLVAAMEDMLGKIRTRNSTAVVLDPLTDSAPALLKEVLNTKAIEHPDEVFQYFATPENLSKLSVQLNKHFQSIDAALVVHTYDVIAYKLSQLRVLSECLQLEECRNVYRDTVKKVQALTGTLLGSVYERLTSCTTAHSSTIESTLQRCANDIYSLFKLDPVRAEHFPSLTHFPSSCTAKAVEVQEEFMRALRAWYNTVCNDPSVLITATTAGDWERIKEHLSSMDTLVSVFKSVFKERKLSLEENTDASTFIAAVADCYSNALLMLMEIFSKLSVVFKKSLGQNDIAGCIQCLDKTRSFVVLLSTLFQVDGEEQEEDERSKKVYADMKIALVDMFQQHSDTTNRVLISKRLIAFTDADIDSIHVSVTVLAFVEDPALLSHYDGDTSFSIADFFSDFKSRFECVLERAQTKLPKIENGYPEGACAVIRSGLLVVGKLREHEVIHAHSIVAYHAYLEEVRGMIAYAYNDASKKLTLLENAQWIVSATDLAAALHFLCDAAMVLEDLPGLANRKEFVDAEQQLRACLECLQESALSTEISVKCPGNLAGLLGPIAFCQELQAYYSQHPSLSGLRQEGVRSISDLLERVLFTFHGKLTALLADVSSLFPADADLVEHKLDIQDAWGAVSNLETLNDLPQCEVEHLRQRAAGFVKEHVGCLGAHLTESFALAADESQSVEEAAFEKKVAAAGKFAQRLEYVRCMAQTCVLNLSAGTKSLHEEVFGPIIALRKEWLEPLAGRVLVHLKKLSDDTAVDQDFNALNTKWYVARALKEVDVLLNIRSSTSVSKELRYALVESKLFELICAVSHSVSLDIKADNYEKVREFFQGRNLKDPVQAAALSGVIKELADRVDCVLTGLGKKMSKLTISLSSVNAVSSIVRKLSKLSSACDCVQEYLPDPLQSILPTQLQLMHAQLLSSIQAQMGTAEAALLKGGFSQGEKVLQAVQQLVAELYGSAEEYKAAMDAAGVPVAQRIDCSRCRDKVTIYCANVRKEFDQCIARVMEEYTVPTVASTEQSSKPTTTKKKSVLSEPAISKIQKLKPAADNGKAPPAASSVTDFLQVFKRFPPKLIAEELSGAAREGFGEFYLMLEAEGNAYIKAKLIEIVACCQDNRLSRDMKQVLLQGIQLQCVPLLPVLLQGDVVALASERLAVLVAEKEDADRQMDEAARTENLTVLIDKLNYYGRMYSFEDYRSCMDKISSALRKVLLRMKEELALGKLISVLQIFPDKFAEMERYFAFCEEYRGRSTWRVWTFRANPFIIDQECINCVNNLVTDIAIAVHKKFMEVHSLSRDDLHLFPLVTTQFDTFLVIYNDLIKSAMPTSQDLGQELTKRIGATGLNDFVHFICTCFEYYNTRIETLAGAEELNPSELSRYLENYSQSDALYRNVAAFAASPSGTGFAELREFSRAFKSYRDIKDGPIAKVFTQMVERVRTVTLLHNSIVTTPNSSDRDHFYAELFRLYKNMSKSAILKPYVNPDVADLSGMESECNAHLSAELCKIQSFMERLLSGGVEELQEAEQQQFSLWYDNLRSFKHAFDATALAQEATDIWLVIRKQFIVRIDAFVSRNILNEQENDRFVSNLIALKLLAANIPLLRKEVDGKIDALLLAVRSQYGAQRIMNLSVVLSTTADPTAQMIIADHKAFEGVQRLLFNTKVARFTKDDVLVDDDSGMRGTDVDRDMLDDEYEEFEEEYKELVSKGLGNHIEAAKECVVEARKIAGNTSLQRTERIRRLLVQLFVYWTLSNADHYFDAVSSGTEEDCSNADALPFPLPSVDLEEQRKYLLQPHAGQVIAIFRIFGFDQHKLGNHLVQIGTGEGKSVILAMVSSVLVLLGYAVHCACYSEYLSRRDYEAFSALFREFGVYDMIVYDTFTDLCERYLNCKGDIREGVEGILHSPPGAPWSRGSVSSSHYASRRKVLLIDEVDVFFNKDFYGNSYCPLAKLSDPTVSALQDSIWKHRAAPKLNLLFVKALPEYASVRDKFPDWEALLVEAVKEMLCDLKTFDTLEVKIKDDQIGYKDQDRVSFKISYGYKTIFAYYKAYSEGKISQASLASKKCILVDCGAYSFAEIPTEYEYIFGVSGTLETLSPLELAVLHDAYRIQHKTFMPSVYGENKREFAPDSGRDIKIESENGFFAAVTNEINERRRVAADSTIQRPILVFFESTRVLRDYYDSVAAQGLRAKLRMMTEEVSAVDKDSIIRQATAPGSITILSREFGRGTDFIIFDERVVNSGGVHVIQTFLSEELSEETQIKGRCARQGCRGSYSMVLSEPRLEQFGITKTGADSIEEMKATSRYYAVLDQKRQAFFADKYRGTTQVVAQIREDHAKAMRFREDLCAIPTQADHRASYTATSCRISNVFNFLMVRNKSTANHGGSRVSRTLVLMDATGSMSRLITNTKNTVKKMFTEALAVLEQAQGVGSSSFEVQFAVYRNYNAPDGELLEYSGWESRPDNLFQFMNSVDANYGMGNEAVEIGLWHAYEETSRGLGQSDGEKYSYQVILIGDMPPNTKEEVTEKRQHRGEGYWCSTRIGAPTHYEKELEKLKALEVPVHAFYVHGRARPEFNQIAQYSGGVSEALEVDSGAGAEKLTGLVTERILSDVGGGGSASEALISDYRRMFPKGYMK